MLDDLLVRIVTEDGTWLHHFGPETEADNGVASSKFTKEIEIQKYTFGRKRYGYCVFRFRRTLACGHHATRNHHLILTDITEVNMNYSSFQPNVKGQLLRQVARELEVSPSVVSRLRNRHREIGQYCRRPGQGRKCKTSSQDDRYIVLSALRQRTETARDLQNDIYIASGSWVSDQTESQEPTSSSTNPARTWRCSKGGMVEYPPRGNIESHWEHAVKVPSCHECRGGHTRY
ncbi:hypothetical protein ANN_23595 [Periplaneta americana]|uniref:Transposase Tc1-like domain-containing protein n=1 Tax=Periplaneta americana TaxID=6978 RepID=A0ABQ8SMZ6_PERAM|nr:hypothetical protein ANN_23595 [Periplaneta americana]